MTSMIEEVARALDAILDDAPPSLSSWNQSDTDALAKAAIEAMMEPTEAMIAAGERQQGRWGGNEDVGCIYEEMTKAALEGE